VHQLLWMFGQGLECSILVVLSPYGWGLMILAFFANRRAKKLDRWPYPTWLFLAWPFFMSLAVIAWGRTHWCEGGSDPELQVPLRWIDFICLLGSALCILLNRNARSATVVVLSLGTIPYLGCSFLATMAVTGLWL